MEKEYWYAIILFCILAILIILNYSISENVIGQFGNGVDRGSAINNNTFADEDGDSMPDSMEASRVLVKTTVSGTITKCEAKKVNEIYAKLREIDDCTECKANVPSDVSEGDDRNTVVNDVDGAINSVSCGDCNNCDPPIPGTIYVTISGLGGSYATYNGVNSLNHNNCNFMGKTCTWGKGCPGDSNGFRVFWSDGGSVFNDVWYAQIILQDWDHMIEWKIENGVDPDYDPCDPRGTYNIRTDDLVPPNPYPGATLEISYSSSTTTTSTTATSSTTTTTLSDNNMPFDEWENRVNEKVNAANDRGCDIEELNLSLCTDYFYISHGYSNKGKLKNLAVDEEKDNRIKLLIRQNSDEYKKEPGILFLKQVIGEMEIIGVMEDDGINSWVESKINENGWDMDVEEVKLDDLPESSGDYEGCPNNDYNIYDCDAYYGRGVIH